MKSLERLIARSGRDQEGDSGEQEHKGEEDRVGRNSDWSPHLHL